MHIANIITAFEINRLVRLGQKYSLPSVHEEATRVANSGLVGTGIKVNGSPHRAVTLRSGSDDLVITESDNDLIVVHIYGRPPEELSLASWSADDQH